MEADIGWLQSFGVLAMESADSVRASIRRSVETQKLGTPKSHRHESSQSRHYAIIECV